MLRPVYSGKFDKYGIPQYQKSETVSINGISYTVSNSAPWNYLFERVSGENQFILSLSSLVYLDRNNLERCNVCVFWGDNKPEFVSTMNAIPFGVVRVGDMLIIGDDLYPEHVELNLSTGMLYKATRKEDSASYVQIQPEDLVSYKTCDGKIVRGRVCKLDTFEDRECLYVRNEYGVTVMFTALYINPQNNNRGEKLVMMMGDDHTRIIVGYHKMMIEYQEQEDENIIV